MKVVVAFIVGFIIMSASICCAQGLPAAALGKGAVELGIWTQGGVGVTGSTSGNGILDVGVRLGKVLTAEHGSGWARGTFEYAVDLVPITVVFQSTSVYGGGFNPVVLKWNFTSGRKLAPWIEAAGGTLFTTRDVPEGTNSVNFRSQAAAGMYIFQQEKRAAAFGIRYGHLSNAGLAVKNRGMNTVEFSVGYHWFR